jgi:hypothetical protein
MSRPTKSNVPAAALCWSVERAGIEFGMTSNTLRRLLNKNASQADSDGLFTTRQITDAVFGGLNKERLATQRQLTRKYQLENAIVEASVVDRAALMKMLAQIADSMVHRITASSLQRNEQEDLLRDLSSIPVALEGVTRAQTRLPAERSNGDDDEQ